MAWGPCRTRAGSRQGRRQRQRDSPEKNSPRTQNLGCPRNAHMTAPQRPKYSGHTPSLKECGIHDEVLPTLDWQDLRRQVRESSSQRRITSASAGPPGWSYPGMHGSDSIPTPNLGRSHSCLLDLLHLLSLTHHPKPQVHVQWAELLPSAMTPTIGELITAIACSSCSISVWSSTRKQNGRLNRDIGVS